MFINQKHQNMILERFLKFQNNLSFICMMFVNVNGRKVNPIKDCITAFPDSQIPSKATI